MSDAKEAMTGIMGSGGRQGAAAGMRENMDIENEVRGLIDFVSFMTSDFMLHDIPVMLSGILSKGFFSFIVVLSVHPFTVSKCVRMKDSHKRKRERYWPFTDHQHYENTWILSHLENIRAYIFSCFVNANNANNNNPRVIVLKKNGSVFCSDSLLSQTTKS